MEINYKMGTWAEINLQFIFNDNSIPDTISKLIDEIDNNDNLQGKFDKSSDCLFLASDRIQNLEWQLEDVLNPILEKHKSIIEEVNGSIMVESGNNFWFEPEEVALEICFPNKNYKCLNCNSENVTPQMSDDGIVYQCNDCQEIYDDKGNKL